MVKSKYRYYYMDIAEKTAELSTARKKRVGAVVVKDDRIISVGHNGTPSGWDNNCEEWKPNEGVHFDVPSEDLDVYGEWHTKPEVLHAEAMQSPNSHDRLSRVRVRLCSVRICPVSSVES